MRESADVTELIGEPSLYFRPTTLECAPAHAHFLGSLALGKPGEEFADATTFRVESLQFPVESVEKSLVHDNGFGSDIGIEFQISEGGGIVAHLGIEGKLSASAVELAIEAIRVAEPPLARP